jgi:hypothetical protein
MAADKWHHIEATYPQAGVLRLFVYNNFTQPMPLGEVKGRAVTREVFDPASGTSKDLAAFALTHSPDGKTLAARLVDTPLPAKVTVKVKFDPKGPEERFDFAFDQYSKEPEATPAPKALLTKATQVPPAATAPPPVAMLSQGQSSVSSIAFDPTRLAGPLPGTAPELLALLKLRVDEVRESLDGGRLSSVWLPAAIGKEIALTLEDHVRSLPDERRAQATSAIKQIVLLAWQLDAYGDLGNAPKLAEAHTAFAAAVSDLTNAYATPTR